MDAAHKGREFRLEGEERIRNDLGVKTAGLRPPSRCGNASSASAVLRETLVAGGGPPASRLLELSREVELVLSREHEVTRRLVRQRGQIARVRIGAIDQVRIRIERCELGRFVPREIG